MTKKLRQRSVVKIEWKAKHTQNISRRNEVAKKVKLLDEQIAAQRRA